MEALCSARSARSAVIPGSWLTSQLTPLIKADICWLLYTVSCLVDNSQPPAAAPYLTLTWESMCSSGSSAPCITANGIQDATLLKCSSISVNVNAGKHKTIYLRGLISHDYLKKSVGTVKRDATSSMTETRGEEKGGWGDLHR